MARGLLGRNNPLHIRQKRRDALQEADLIILAGMQCLHTIYLEYAWISKFH